MAGSSSKYTAGGLQNSLRKPAIGDSLKHLSFAKIRFDPTADPCAKVAFMLLPLAVMLAFIGSDERSKIEVRERAKKLLKRLDRKFALGIGVSAAWA